MDLPLEILLLIAEFAAWEESWDNKGWVSSLMRVSCAFKTAVHPILYHCITIDRTNYKRLYDAASAGLPAFALTRKIVVLVRLSHQFSAGADTDSVLADVFAHVQYVAGDATAVMDLLNARKTANLCALSLSNPPDTFWFPNRTMQKCTHLHIPLDPAISARRGFIGPALLREMASLTHFALDVADDAITPAGIYNKVAPSLPLSVRRFLFRQRWRDDSPLFGALLMRVACERRDARLWFDEGTSVDVDLPNTNWSLPRSRIGDLKLGLELWVLGVQLYTPSSGAT
ncbi:hypothetical protein AURDEDRAFT_159114 [Auricularia subglabra TFB-10046 SS5]|nr:hypothetical protein AURDEDRAFT_159114 [Auricularia subglabra TFB-10046 SS5]